MAKKASGTIAVPSSVLLFLFLLISFLAACILAPIVEMLLRKGLSVSADIQTILVRTALAVFLVLCVIFRSSLKCDVSGALDLRFYTVLFHLMMGLFVSFALILVATGVVGLFGIKVVRFSADGLVWKVVAFSLLVAVAEEVLHRGFIFQSLSSELGSFLAIIFSSAVFSMLHFTYPPNAASLSGNSMDILSGFKALPRILERFTDFGAILPDAAGYFLLGSLFCVMCLKLDSLYAAVAAHALLAFVNLSEIVTFKGRFLVGRDMVFGGHGSVSETFIGSLMAWFLILLAIIGFLAVSGLSSEKRGRTA